MFQFLTAFFAAIGVLCSTAFVLAVGYVFIVYFQERKKQPTKRPMYAQQIDAILQDARF